MANVSIKFLIIFAILGTSAILCVNATDESGNKLEVNTRPTCESALGTCSANCGDDCCSQRCLAKYVGVGHCVRLGNFVPDTMMMGADYYQTDSEIAACIANGKVPIGVGQNTKITNCIIDKNAKIGKDVVIANKDNVEEGDRSDEGFYIRSGITVILKNATVKDGTIV